MNYNILKTLFFVALIIVPVNANSASYKFPKNLLTEPELFNTINKITILPVIDERKEKFIFYIKTDLNDILRATMSGGLITLNGYKVNNPESYGLHKTVISSDLLNPSKEWVRKLGPEESTHCLLLVFFDTQSISTTGSMGNAAVGAYLFDKKSGKLVWRYLIGSETWEGWIMAPDTDYFIVIMAIRNAVLKFMKWLPKNGTSQESFIKMVEAEYLESIAE